jgi:predicted DNA-binding transcriptional regulator AlpA
MQKADQQTAPASGEANVPDENQPQTRLPRENEGRFESDKELKAFIDEKQLLVRLPVSRRTLFNWRAAGKIPSVRLGGRRVLFHWPSVEAALLRMQRGGGQ